MLYDCGWTTGRSKPALRAVFAACRFAERAEGGLAAEIFLNVGPAVAGNGADAERRLSRRGEDSWRAGGCVRGLADWWIVAQRLAAGCSSGERKEWMVRGVNNPSQKP
jgi:hypothetical protein